MNQKVEEIFHPPVIITCPRINAGITSDYSGSSAEINMAAFQNEFLSRHQQPTTSKTLNSSDSCSSILLGYVDGRTHELNKVIDSRGENDVKREDLLKLVDKLNKQKAILLSEIEKSVDTVPTINLENILKQLRNIDMEKENILINENDDGNKENICARQQKELEEREKILKQKEQTLERQIKKLFLKEEAAKQKKKENKANQTSQKIKNVEIQTETVNRNCDIDILETSNNSTLVSNESSYSSSVGQRAPVKIIINVNGTKKEKSRKSPTSSSRQTSAKINDAPGQVFPKTPAKKSEPTEKMEKVKEKPKQIQLNIPTDGGESISTVYRSPPQTIRTDLTKFIENKSKIQQQKLAVKKSKKTTTDRIENPMLKHYIARLLGMSRASIEQLGVSSSTSIETPSTSIVNVSENRTITNDTASSIPDEDRMEKLERFIADNHSFLSEVEQSLRHHQRLDETNDGAQDIEIVEQIWMKTLKEKEQKMKKEKTRQKPKEKEIKPILRKKEIQKTVVSDAQINDKNQKHEDLSKKYADLAASCSQRFAHLNEMIQKVRQEKQKLLETTFSAASETTEFLEFAGQQETKKNLPESNECSQATTTTGKSLSYKDDLQFADLEQNKLMNSKQMGMSRDSGICTSRPVTSSDVRDSPDIRFLQKENTPAYNEKDLKETDKFEPLLKDIPKYDYRLDPQQQQPTTSSNYLSKCDKISSTSKDETGKKASKPPPTTLTR